MVIVVELMTTNFSHGKHMPNTIDVSQENINDVFKLQPMGVGDILDATFSLYRKHFQLFLGIASIYFFGLLIEYSIKGFIIAKVAKASISTLVAMPFAIISISGVVFASATIYLGRNITSSAALRQALRRFFPILGSHLIWRLVLAITFGSILFSMLLIVRQGASGILLAFIVLPFALYFTVCWAFHIQIVLLEKPNVIYALKRSAELILGNWWRTAGILTLILLTSYAIAIIFKVSFGFILIFAKLAGNTDLRSVIEWSIMEKVLDSSNFIFYAIMTCVDLILTTLVFPIWAIGTTLLYFDRTIRIETDDIEPIENPT